MRWLTSGRAPLRHLCTAMLLWSAAGARSNELTWQVCQTVELRHGDLDVLFRDNSQSPGVLSGADRLVNVRDAPGFDAFDPDSPGASAGLNFEHIIVGHASPHNRFTPRSDKYVLERAVGLPTVRLVRHERDDPWRISSTLTYTLVEPHAIDLDFRCRAHDPRLFEPRGYAVLFFANYMNDMSRVALNFLGHEREGGPQRWIAADAPQTHPDYNGGGTYRAAAAPALEYDPDHDFKLNLWSYDQPRFTQPFYYGLAANGMTLLMMFDRAYSERDEIRFSLFKFKIPRFPRPALDWQYVIHHVRTGEDYGFRARAVWKRFVSSEDCRQEYERWVANLPQPH
ncbi:MAG TPA: hypothetical protein VHV08_01815 [Pirellulales bacterium]|nr:hypothetical protein [Pirellulales bacterium]